MKMRAATHSLVDQHTIYSIFFVFSADICSKINKLLKYYEYQLTKCCMEGRLEGSKVSSWFLKIMKLVEYRIAKGCLHDTGATFAPERAHSGSLSWLYICLHDTTTKCHAGASHLGMSSCIGARISLRYETSQRYHTVAHRYGGP